MISFSFLPSHVPSILTRFNSEWGQLRIELRNATVAMYKRLFRSSIPYRIARLRLKTYLVPPRRRLRPAVHYFDMAGVGRVYRDGGEEVLWVLAKLCSNGLAELEVFSALGWINKSFHCDNCTSLAG